MISPNQTKTFAYDSADRKTLVLKPDGNQIQYTYGYGSNPTKEEWLVGASVVQTLNFQYDAVGKMTSASDAATSLAFTYTDGLLSREKQTLAAGIIAQSDYVYAGGRVMEVSLGLGASATFDSKVAYTYTANGQIATLQQTGPTTDTKSVRYSYDQAENRIRTERFSDVAFATPVFETLSSYTNAQSQLKSTVQSIKHQRATGTILASYDFVWDAGNRLSSMTSTADGLTSYSYTATNQLSSIDYASIPDQSFSYDSNGNRTGSGNVTGADNRLSSNATWNFLYDANGNMTRRTLKSDNSYIEYTYDHRDRLTDVRYKTSAGTLTKRVHFGYDALNRRYLQTVENGSGTILSTVYYVNQGMRKDRGDAGDEVALRLNAAGAVISRYLHGSLVDEVLAEENIGSGGVRDVLWPMTDHQGSVRDLARVTAGTATVVNHIVYDAFGRTVSETDAAITHLYGYTGRELDKETGLQYTRARYYDPVLGRFISQDPIGFAAGDANLYRYVGNHPTMATDPSGLQEREKKPIGIFFPTRAEFERRGEPFTKSNHGFWGGYRGNASYDFYLGYAYGVTDERVMYSQLGFDPDSVTAKLRFTEVYRDKFAYLELKGMGTDGKELTWYGMYEGGYQGKPHVGYTFFGSEDTLRYNLSGMNKAEALESLSRSYGIASGAAVLSAIRMNGAIVPFKYAVAPKGLAIQFGKDANQISHAFRHLAGVVDKAKAASAISDDLNAAAGSLTVGLNIRKVVVDGVELTYNAFKFPDGLINVGRITIPKP